MDWTPEIVPCHAMVSVTFFCSKNKILINTTDIIIIILDIEMKYIIATLALMMFATSAYAQDVDPNLIKTESTTDSNVTTKSDTTTTLKSPPASAISPTINTSNSDLCTFGVAGAVQTQILGMSMGTQITDKNCERLKNAKTLYDMGMKVAAVSVMCQDKRVFDAMMNAGTPCPYDGLIGDDAKAAWKVHSGEQPEEGDQEPKIERTNDEKTLFGTSLVFGLLLLLLL